MNNKGFQNSVFHKTLKNVAPNDRAPRFQSPRFVFFEALESRTLLSISPSEIPTSAFETEIVAPAVVDDGAIAVPLETIDLSASDATLDAANHPKSLKILLIGNSLTEDARTFLADAAAQYPGIAPENIKLGCLYQGGRSLGYFANCARVERGADPSEYDNDSYGYTNDQSKSQVDAPNNGYLDASQNFCEYYEWNGLEWKLIKDVKNRGEKTIEYATTLTDWDVVLIQGFYHDFADGSVANAYNGTQSSFSPDKADDPYNLKESLCSNLEYLCDYLKSLNEDISVGFYVPTIHHETQTCWLDGDMFGSMVRTTEYVLNNTSCVDFVVPGGAILENAKTTYLGSLTYDDPSGRDVVTQGLRRDTIHSSNYLGRELLAIGIVECVVNYLYGDEADVRSDYDPLMKMESPSYDSLPLGYADVVRAAVAAAVENPLEIVDLSALGTKDPALVAFEAAKERADAGGDVEECLAAARNALSERQLVDLVINYEDDNGAASLSFTYGYTTSDSLLIAARKSEIKNSSAFVVVNSLNDVVDLTDGLVTLREAITIYANDGDAIIFSPKLAGATISINGAQIDVHKTLTIDASALYDETNGAAGLSIDAGGISRIFEIVSGKTTLKGLRLVGGSSFESGGAIKVDAFASLTLENVVLQGNVAELYGGAIGADATAAVSVVDSSLFGNSAGLLGGAVYASSASLDIANSILSENAAQFGGAVAATASATLTIDASVLHDNVATHSGGAVYATGVNAVRTITNAKIHHNVANSGAGVYSSGYQSVLTLQNSSVYQNTSVQEGSALEVKTGKLDVYHSTISKNVSNGNSAGVYTYYADSYYYNSIVILNVGSNLVKKGGTTSAFNVLSNVRNWSNDNAVWYLYNNKSPLFTDANNGDFTLSANSQAFDKGDDAFVATTRDLAGNWRVMGDSVDLGAYEYAIAESASTTVDSLVNAIDPYDGLITLREAVEVYASEGDAVRFTPYLQGGTVSINGDDVTISPSLKLDARTVRLAESVDYDACYEPTVNWQYDDSTRKATLEWAPIANATSYLVKISKDGGTTWLTYARDLADTSCVVNGLYFGTTYAFIVYGYNASREKQTETRRVVFDPSTCFNPKLTASYNAATRQAALSWDAISGAESYLVKISRDRGTTWLTYARDLTDTSCVVNGLYQGKTYEFMVYGYSASREKLTETRRVAFEPAIYFNPELAASYSAATQQVTLSWNTNPGAASYVVSFSQNDLKQRVYVDSLEETECVVDNVRAGSSYTFRVYGVDKDGVPLSATLESTLAPIEMNVSLVTGTAGTVCNVTLAGARSASADVKWYYVTDEGDVEIEEAANLLQYAPTDLQHNIKVVATGTGFSKGSNATQTILNTLKSSYNTETSLTTLTWDAIDDAESYLVMISRDNGITWTTSVKNLTEPAATVSGLSPGKSYNFMVYGVASNVRTSVQGTTFAPISVDPSVVYYAAGARITATLKEAENAACDVRWYYVTEEGDVEIEDAVNATQFLISDYACDVRIVATGTGDSEGSVSETTVSFGVSFVHDFTTRQTVMTWDAIPGAVSYRVNYKIDNKTMWTKYADGLAEPSLTISDVNIGSFYQFRIYGVDEAGAYLYKNRLEETFAPVMIAGERPLIEYEPATRRAVVAWEEDPYAASYQISVSKDGGETWSVYAKNLSERIQTINGLYVGKSYVFQILGFNAEKIPVLVKKATFEPIGLTAFVSSNTINATTTGAGNASAVFNWFYVTEEGDVEIEEAAGLKKFTPERNDYPVKIVATGTSYAKGSCAEITVGGSVAFDYDEKTREAAMTWEAIPGAESYLVKLSKDNGTTWVVYARGLTETNVLVRGLYAGNCYRFQVYGIASSGAEMSFVETASFSPIAITSSVVAYSSYQKAIEISVKGALNAHADLRWFYVTEEGDAEILDAAGQTQYTVPNDKRVLKIVATGLLNSQGSNSELTLNDAAIMFAYDGATQRVTLHWNIIKRAQNYRVEMSSDKGKTWEVVGESLIRKELTVNSIAIGQYYDFRIFGIDAKGVELAEVLETTFTPYPVNDAQISFVNYDAAKRTATMVWNDVPGAASYIVKLSKNEGETWLTYAKGLTEPTKKVQGLQVGMRYDFRVYAVDENNVTISVSQISTYVPEVEDSSSLLDEAFAEILFEEF